MAPADLRLLFLTGLTLAGVVGCTRTDAPLKATADPNSAPSTSTTVKPSVSASAVASSVASAGSSDDPRLVEAKAYALQFHSAGPFAKAFTKAELLGFIDVTATGTVCEPAPCSKEWSKLVASAYDAAVVIRRNGAVEAVHDDEYMGVVGAIDTPEKAALFVRLQYRTGPGTCGDLSRIGATCASGSDPGGVAVRTVGKDYEVITYGERNVCRSPQRGDGIALGATTVSSTGEVDDVDNAFVELTAEKARLEGNVTCRYPNLGRMFEGFVDLPPERSELEYYVRAQRQEAAAVIAFERLATELTAHGAPVDLIGAVLRAADEERRHTALFRREAERLCAETQIEIELPGADEPSSFPIRSLAEILQENIVEGCVNETYAAIVATHQAERAPTARLRAIFGAIADDERGHAALAYRIHAWGLATVDASLSADLSSACAIAHTRAHEELAVTPLGLLMGEPEPARALVAFDHISRKLPSLVSAYAV